MLKCINTEDKYQVFILKDADKYLDLLETEIRQKYNLIQNLIHLVQLMNFLKIKK